MAVKQVKYNDTFIYINDEVDIKDTGIKIDKDKYENETKVIEVIDKDKLNELTSLNLFGEKHE